MRDFNRQLISADLYRRYGRMAYLFEMESGKLIGSVDTVKVILSDVILDLYGRVPMKIRSGRDYTYPCSRLSYSSEWTGDSFDRKEGSFTYDEMKEYDKHSFIPEVYYFDNFSVELAEGFEMRCIKLMDKDLKPLDNLPPDMRPCRA